ncbi:MAG: hypothetical protein ACXWLO_11245 [Rhizomicrobium sp.]
MRASLTTRIAQGLLEEERLVNGAKVSAESKGAVHVYFAECETRKISDIPAVRRPGRSRRPRSSAPARWTAYATHLAIFGQTFIVLAFVSPAGPELTFAESGALECEPGCLKAGYPYGLPRLSEGELRQRFDRFASGR